MSSREILFLNAAIQNQDFSLDEKPYKATGILAARVLNTLSGHTTPEVHSWNNVGAFDEALSSTSRDRLAQKYDSVFAQTYIAPPESTHLIETDDGAEFGEWASDVLVQALEQGTIYEEEAAFTHCTYCGVTLAEAAAGITVCPRCHDNTNLRTQNEIGIFATTPPPDVILPHSKIANQINMHHEISTLQQLPPRLLLSRTRGIGISLDVLGYGDKKLDPRLGIGLLAVYIAAKHDYETAGIVQSVSTLNRVAPYIAATLPDPQQFSLPDVMYAFHGKVQPELFHRSATHPQALALYSLGQRSDITTKSLPKITKETGDLARRFDIVSNVYKKQFGIHREFAGRSRLDTITNLTNIVGQTNKNLGRSLEAIKHHAATDETQRIEVESTLDTSATLLRAIDISPTESV